MYLTIEGVIGVGKTSLARYLQGAFGTPLLLEVFEENPFLSDFYGDRTRYAFQTQIFFLLSRYHQQRAVPSLVAQGGLVADYAFAKDALFAQLNLAGEELRLYHQLHGALAERITPPDLLIYLRAPTDLLLARIARRGRDYEKNMDPGYITALNQAYDEFLAQPLPFPVLTLPAEQLDFVAQPADLEIIIQRIQAALQLSAYPAPLPLTAPEADHADH